MVYFYVVTLCPFTGSTTGQLCVRNGTCPGPHGQEFDVMLKSSMQRLKGPKFSSAVGSSGEASTVRNEDGI